MLYNTNRPSLPGERYTICIQYKVKSCVFLLHSRCQFKALMSHIADVCSCVPEYVPNVRSMIENSTLRACNFYEHATCVSYVNFYFDPVVSHCIPACLDSEYFQSRIQVLLTKLFQTFILFYVLVCRRTSSRS